MKKKAFSWMTIMLMAFVCVGFAACGGDDDGDNDGVSQSNVLVGRWEGAHSEKYWEDYTFNSNGTGERDVHNDGLGGTESFYYVIKSQKTENNSTYGETIRGEVEIRFTSGGNYTWDFKINRGKYLTINGYDCTKY